jgi:hypothetical protein
VDRTGLDRFGDLYAGGAGIEPDPAVIPDMVGINYLKHACLLQPSSRRR